MAVESPMMQGRSYLAFSLPSRYLTVCNTWLQNKKIHRVTWQHPKSKQWSCIDYVIMRERVIGGCAQTLL